MIYFGRHGEVPANIAHIFNGSLLDEPLTKNGLMQARCSGMFLLSEEINIESIVASPLLRARRTAQMIARVIGFDRRAITFDKRLVEYGMGELEGRPMEGVSPHELISAQGAEDPYAFQTRVMAALHEAATEPGNTLIISHAGVGRVIECTRRGINPAEFFAMPGYNNAQIVPLDWLVATE